MIVTPSTVTAYVDRLKATRGPSEHTIRAYTCDLRSYSGFLAERQLCPREEGTLIAYARFLSGEKAAAPRTLRRRMACLRGFYKEMVRSGILAQSPFRDLELQLPRARILPRGLTRAQAAQLADAAWRVCLDESTGRGAKAFPAAILLLISTGLRVGELVQLRPQDLDPETGSLLVQGKGQRERRVFVTDERLRALLVSLARSEKNWLLASHGRQWSTQGVRRSLRRFAAEAGIAERVTPHMLRHTCATLLLEDGVDLRFLQRLLGHQNITTTAIYAHVGDAGLRQALENARLLSSLRLAADPLRKSSGPHFR